MDYLKKAPKLYDQMKIDFQLNKWLVGVGSGGSPSKGGGNSNGGSHGGGGGGGGGGMSASMIDAQEQRHIEAVGFYCSHLIAHT